MATLTITTTGAQDARIAPAFGAYLGLGRNATGQEVKARIIQFIREVVQEQERIAALAAVQPTPIDST